jgi:tRNA pseudouridine synthase 10
MLEDADLGAWIDRVRAAAGEYEFRTFLLGTALPRSTPPDEALAIRHRWNRTVGRALEAAWPRRVVDFHHPDVRFVMNPGKDRVEITAAPLFVYGRYVKDARDISQARWHCQRCHGRGCPRCGGTGHRYPMTVEEAIGRPLREQTGATESRIHGAGREDVDARMLGRGRPFVMTLSEPRRRSPDLERAAAGAREVSGGRVSVRDLRLVPRSMIRTVTQARCEKVYRAEVEGAADWPDDAADRVVGLAPLTLSQRTPQRVLRRRSDLVRFRRVLELSLEPTGARTLDLRLRTEAGTYVKEFVSGDGERTSPSLTSILGVPCEVKTLDVLEVDYDPFAGESDAG